jgi:hypothetical protein
MIHPEYVKVLDEEGIYLLIHAHVFQVIIEIIYFFFQLFLA